MSKAIELAEEAERLSAEAPEGDWKRDERGVWSYDADGCREAVITASVYPGDEGKVFISESVAALVLRSRTLVPEMAAELRKADQCIATLEADVACGRNIVRLALKDDERVRTTLVRATGRKVENMEDMISAIADLMSEAMAARRQAESNGRACDDFADELEPHALPGETPIEALRRVLKKPSEEELAGEARDWFDTTGTLTYTSAYIAGALRKGAPR